MTAPIRALYLTESKCHLALFDLRCPGTEELLRRELAGWRGSVRAETPIGSRVVLVLRPGEVAR
jgi:hypothetical protein